MLLFSSSFSLTAAAFVALIQGSVASSIFTSGHGDVAVGFHDGEFEFGYHLAEGNDEAIVDGVVVDDMEFEADELIVSVTEQAMLTASSDPNLLSGTGTEVGDIVYLISQNSTGVDGPILGFDTEELLQPAGVTWSDVEFTVNGFSGPGEFFLFDIGLDGLEFFFSEELSVNSFTFPPDGHDEANWFFTEPGTYEIELTAEATRTEMGVGQDFEATETFTFQVIPEPSSALLLAGSTLGLLLRRRRS